MTNKEYETQLALGTAPLWLRFERGDLSVVDCLTLEQLTFLQQSEISQAIAGDCSSLWNILKDLLKCWRKAERQKQTVEEDARVLAVLKEMGI